MFYAPPKRTTAEVFAQLPSELRAGTEANEWVQGQPIGMPHRSMLEGPSFDRAGSLWCVDIANGRILRVSPDGIFAVIAEYDGWPNGLKFQRDGRVFVADYKHGLMLLDPVNGHIAPFLVRAGLERFKELNDLVFASNGDLYFTDQGMTGLHDPTGRVFRLRADGRLECLLNNLPSPNGLVLNRDETTLFVAVTRANAVWRVPLLRDGGVGKVGTYVQLSGGGGPDGMALDEGGGLAIAHVGLGAVWIVDGRGEPTHRIDGLSAHTTNVAYGGVDRRSLYITDSGAGAILRVQVDVPGASMFGLA
jgi:gluconolactonase